MRGGPKDNFLRSLIVATIAIAAPAVANSADFKFVGTQVTMNGLIIDGDSQKFQDTIGDKLVRSIVLDSRGGDVLEAMDIGERIRLKNADTTVGPDGKCASACALIWAAGTHRSIADGGRVGFHAAYNADTQKSPTGVGNALIGAYLTKLGYDYPAVIFATDAAPDEMNWLNPEYAEKSGFIYEAKNIVEAQRPVAEVPLKGCAKVTAQVAELFGSAKGFSCKE